MQGVGPGGAYAYWQPDGQPGAPQTLILNAHGPPGAVPVTVPRVGNSGVESSRQPQNHNHGANHGGRGKEKGGKGRRGGAAPARRGGGDAKHQSNAVCSPLL
jgi:hypothetical protein